MTQDIRFTIGAMDATGPAITSATRNVDRLRDSIRRANNESQRGAATGGIAGGMMSRSGLGPGGAFGLGAALNPAVMRFAGVAAATGEAMDSLRDYVDLMKQAAFNGRTLTQELDKQGKIWVHMVPVARHFVDLGRLMTGDLMREQRALGEIERLKRSVLETDKKRAQQAKLAGDLVKQESESWLKLRLTLADDPVEAARITRDAAIAKAEADNQARLEAIKKAGFTPAAAEGRRHESERIASSERAEARERFNAVQAEQDRALQEMRQAQESSARTLGSQLRQVEMETAGDLLGARLEAIREAAQQRIEAEQQASERIRRLFGDESDEIKRGLQERVKLIEQLRDAEIQSVRMRDLEERAQPFLDSILQGHQESLERLQRGGVGGPFDLVRGGLLHDAPGAPGVNERLLVGDRGGGMMTRPNTAEEKTAAATSKAASAAEQQVQLLRGIQSMLGGSIQVTIGSF